ncbi:MAG: Ribosomal protein S8 [uncultured bacterium]|nr:MAG: Ribosomal protein S8 [uncultured bacterium]HBD05277.1 30S ribosomal protein S8 [Candidatus Uhrbacteria bacterium]
MVNDPISDMLTRIRNAYAVSKTEVVLPSSKMKYAIAKILEKEGFLASTNEKAGSNNFKSLHLTLKYEDGNPAVSEIKRVSKPGRRVYQKALELSSVRSGYGLSIISTPNGLMTNFEARRRKLGGEVICEIS